MNSGPLCSPFLLFSFIQEPPEDSRQLLPRAFNDARPAHHHQEGRRLFIS